MPTITNGTVEIERQVRPADYESKKVKVALSFAVDEAEKVEHVLEHVGQMAHDHVMAMLKRVESVFVKQEPTATANPSPATIPQTSSLGAVAATVSNPMTNDGNATSPGAGSNQSVSPSIVTDAQVLEVIQAVLNRAGADKEAVNRKIVETICEVTGAVGASYRTIPADDPRRVVLVAKLSALGPDKATQGVPAY